MPNLVSIHHGTSGLQHILHDKLLIPKSLPRHLKGGHRQYPHCRRQCTKVHSANLFCAKCGKFFHFHFSVIRMGSHSTFVLSRFILCMIMFSIWGPTSASITITTYLIQMVMTVKSLIFLTGCGIRL